jgi:uncharacterized circularly permuted ATP-grasp superfamily protein/uncharacterized alpha-E superfamily protein
MTGNTQSSPTIDGSIFADLAYRASAGAFDEMLAAAGALRPHWQALGRALDTLGRDELRRRWQEARQLISESGVTYNIYGDPRGLERPWQLDPVPLIVSAAEAAFLEAGLIQRARLLERVLADVYGPQQLLRDGLLPPEVVFGNPAFLRACHGAALPGNRYLLFYAADLGRTPAGSFLVLGDRTQAPTGAGYALENRIVLTRMLPDVFRDCHVQRLALFFHTFRQTLRSIAPRERDSPHIVLLTPGPNDETYFEHAFLSRYLGYTMVEGGDLTVRDNRLYHKLLGGLQRVDVVLRRLPDQYCDPLELRGDAFPGVPGLVQAVHSGNVALANPLGSGWMESSALLPYLPALCRHLLGEDLKIPTAPTWWCGQPQSLQHVLSNLAGMVIKPAFPDGSYDPIFAGRLDDGERAALAERLRARPQDFTAQEQVELSTAPVLAGDGLEPRRLVMRAYACAKEDSFTVMPGGLTRVTGSADALTVSIQDGGGSKDTWVLASGPVSTFSLLRPQTGAVELTRGGGDLPSRAADNLFWLGRYVERAEGSVRLLRGILVRLTERAGLADVPEIPALLRAFRDETQRFAGQPGIVISQTDPEKELQAILFDPRRAGSLAATLAAVDRVAGMVRDRISLDMWRTLSVLREKGREGGEARDQAFAVASPLALRPACLTLSDVLEILDRTVMIVSAFGGLAAESMTRGHAWRFLDMGRRLERAAHLLSLLQSTLVTAANPEGPLLEAILEIADSVMTYKRRYLHGLSPAPVLDMLLADETNPRSVAFQLLRLGQEIEHLPHDPAQAGCGPEQRFVLSASTTLRLADIPGLAKTDAAGNRPELDKLLKRLAAELPLLSDAITRRYLAHLQPSRQMAEGTVRP